MMKKSLNQIMQEYHYCKNGVEKLNKTKNEKYDTHKNGLKKAIEELKYVHEICLKDHKFIEKKFWNRKKPWYPTSSIMIKKLGEMLKKNEASSCPKDYVMFPYIDSHNGLGINKHLVSYHLFDDCLSCFPAPLLKHLIFEEKITQLKFIKCKKELKNHTKFTDGIYNVLSFIAEFPNSKSQRYFDIVEDPNTKIELKKEKKCK